MYRLVGHPAIYINLLPLVALLVSAAMIMVFAVRLIWQGHMPLRILCGSLAVGYSIQWLTDVILDDVTILVPRYTSWGYPAALCAIGYVSQNFPNRVYSKVALLLFFLGTIGGAVELVQNGAAFSNSSIERVAALVPTEDDTTGTAVLIESDSWQRTYYPLHYLLGSRVQQYFVSPAAPASKDSRSGKTAEVHESTGGERATVAGSTNLNLERLPEEKDTLELADLEASRVLCVVAVTSYASDRRTYLRGEEVRFPKSRAAPWFSASPDWKLVTRHQFIAAISTEVTVFERR